MLKRRRNDAVPPPEDCALTVCVRYMGGAWTPNILWYLSSGARRFNELKHDLQGVSSKVLAQRLKRLELDGLVVRHEIASSPPSVEYQLSSQGHELQPALAILVRVGHQLKQRQTKAA